LRKKKRGEGNRKYNSSYEEKGRSDSTSLRRGRHFWRSFNYTRGGGRHKGKGGEVPKAPGGGSRIFGATNHLKTGTTNGRKMCQMGSGGKQKTGRKPLRLGEKNQRDRKKAHAGWQWWRQAEEK